jgi:hypothetical protein
MDNAPISTKFSATVLTETLFPEDVNEIGMGSTRVQEKW